VLLKNAHLFLRLEIISALKPESKDMSLPGSLARRMPGDPAIQFYIFRLNNTEATI
jgi:hypothetical protein